MSRELLDISHVSNNGPSLRISLPVKVKDALLQLSKIYMTDIGERTIVAEILDMKPELFPKNAPS